MMASMLAPAPANPPGRISQLLPTVKCSNCNNPVPLAELGEHICPKAPPVPALPEASPSSSKPLGQRLPVQNLVAASPKANPVQFPSNARPAPAQLSTSQHRPTPSTSSDRSRKSSVSSLSPFTPKPSPLSRPEGNRAASPGRESHSPTVSSPLRIPSTASSMDYRTRTVSNASSGSSPRTARPSFSSSRNTPSPTPTVRQPSPRQPSPQPQPQSPSATQPHSPSQTSLSSVLDSPPIDTKTGGEAGMAGVGRRGFAAVAHAAVFLSPMLHTQSHNQNTLQSRRENAPRTLDISAALKVSPTPPLSAGSGYSTPSPGPVSPQSQIPSPSSTSMKPSSRALIADPSTSPVSPLGFRSPFFDKPRKLSGDTPLTLDTSSEFHRSDSDAPHDEPSPPSPSSGSEYGLAYADSTDYEDEEDLDVDGNSPKGRNPPPPPLPLTDDRKGKGTALAYQESTASTSSTSSRDRGGLDRSNSAKIAQALGLSQTPLTSYGKMGGPPNRGGRTLSSSSNGSKSAYSRTSSVSSGAGLGAIASSSSVAMNGRLERAMETLLEDAESSRVNNPMPLSKSKSTGKQAYFERNERKDDNGHLTVSSPSGLSISLPTRSNTVGVVYSPETKAVKLPTRARTERERSTESLLRKSARRVKMCVRCEKRIEDGRWIQVDSGSILCERCWKNMYLPKCRRCDLPIEKQAVSSSDGQLKGKYHRNCFNCHECHKPFPDKTFYVFDGKPLCGYHYHEANRSLCAATSCGQPIEGPCAVSHTGARYHPEHLFCEFPGCEEKLEEYWEIDRLMYCQRHAKWGGQVNEADSKATKRITRFIDLSGAEPGLR